MITLNLSPAPPWWPRSRFFFLQPLPLPAGVDLSPKEDDMEIEFRYGGGPAGTFGSYKVIRR